MDWNAFKNLVGTSCFLIMAPLGLVALIGGWQTDHSALAACGAAVLIGHLYLLFQRKGPVLRFLYPGLITFVLFMVVPICMTVVIGFTNIGTGHFLTPSQSQQAITEQKKLWQDSPALSFSLHPIVQSDDSYLLQVQSEHGIFSAPIVHGQWQQVLSLTPSAEASEAAPLSLAAVFALRTKLRQLEIKLPGFERTYSYFRADRIAALGERYQAKEQGIVDLATQKYYGYDHDSGFYRYQNEKLFPGFFSLTGLENFRRLISDEFLRVSFAKVVGWTLVWALASVILSFSLGLLLAVILHSRYFTRKALYRTLLIIPYAIPFFISVLIFRGLLNKDFGLINQFLGVTIPWLEDGFWAKISCLMVNLWLGFPYMFLVATGILQSIPHSIYEAAALDGASKWNTLRRVTLPMILSGMVPLLIGSFAFNLNNFVGIYLLTGGGPALEGATSPVGSTDILISYTYRLAFEGARGQDLGLASAISLIIFALVAMVTFVQFRWSNTFAKESL